MGIAVESRSSSSAGGGGGGTAAVEGTDASGARISADSLTGDWDFADVPYVDATAGGISLLARTERRVELCSAHRQKGEFVYLLLYTTALGPFVRILLTFFLTCPLIF